MPPILFDPPIEESGMIGGKLEGARRAEYLELCKQMTSRNPSLDYIPIRDRILDILQEDVREHISTIEEFSTKWLLSSIDTIFSSIDKTDPNTLATINIVSLQISILFTHFIYMNSNKTFRFIDTKPDYEYLTNNKGKWKEYSFMKTLLESSRLSMLLNDNQSPRIFMAFIGFLKIGELLETYFNNVFYLGLSYGINWVDGDRYMPLDYLSHDIFHYEMYESCYEFPTIMETFKKFRNYVVSTKDAPTRYSVDFALFLFLHEEPYCNRFESDDINNELQKGATYESILDSLEIHVDEDLLDINHFGQGIPIAYREFQPGHKSLLKREKVVDYLELVAERYMACWAEFSAAVPEGGRRRRNRRTRRAAGKRRGTRKFIK